MSLWAAPPLKVKLRVEGMPPPAYVLRRPRSCAAEMCWLLSAADLVGLLMDTRGWYPLPVSLRERSVRSCCTYLAACCCWPCWLCRLA